MVCSGASCNPSAHFPKPGDRRNGAPLPVNGDMLARREPRRPRFYSAHLDRVTDLVQQPASITFREFAILVLALFALYKGYFAGDRAYTVLARRDIGQVCRGATAMQCLRYHLWQLLWIACDWAGDVGMWLAAGAVAVFFGEEVFAKAKAQFLKK